MYYILSVNPGSTSTKVALYEDEKKLFTENIEHTREELDGFEKIPDQLEYRKALVIKTVMDKGYKLEDLSAIVGRGGLVPNLETGGYLVNEKMEEVLKSDYISAHASNLGGLIAKVIADPLKIPAYIYDAVTSGELSELAKITGMPDVTRQSRCHALNSRAMARKCAEMQGKKYEEMNFIVSHLGGGISASAHRNGHIIDSVADDDGQFSPERSGSVPLLDVIDLCYSGKHTKEEMKQLVRGKGGMYAHLGTSDCRVIEQRIKDGDQRAKLVFEAQAYQIAKGIGLLSITLLGEVDNIILTGGVANSNLLTSMIEKYVKFIAPVVVLPGEIELTVKTIVETPSLLKIAGLEGIGKAEAANLLTEAYAVAINMIPSTMICWGLMFSYFDYKLISNSMNKRGKTVLMLPAFSDFSLPRRAVYGCLLIYILSWMAVGLKIVSEDAMLLNVQAIIEFVFAVQGFAVVIYTTKQNKMNKVLRWAIYIVLLVSPFGRKFLALFGFFDLLVGIRQKLEKK